MKSVIIMGGVVQNGILAQKMKERGYYTILVDYLDNPPAKKVVDEHVQISTFDYEAVKKLAQERKVDLIMNSSLEHINKEIARLAEDLSLPMLYSYETALNVSDKRRMKTIMREKGIPTTKFSIVTATDMLSDLGLSYPIFVKPADGKGSTAVNKVVNQAELEHFTQVALDSSKVKAAIVEEEAVGKECNVYCVIVNGKATVLTLSEKYSEIRGKDSATKAIGSLTPAVVTDAAMEEIKAIAQKIADGFELKTTPMFMQIKVNKDEINVIEFACRMAGGYSYQNIKKNMNFDYFDFTIDAFLGNTPKFQMPETGSCSSIHSIYAYPCVFDRVEGLEEMKQNGIVTDYLVVRGSGTTITNEAANKQKIGFFITKGRNYQELFSMIKLVFDNIEAYDTDGNKVLRKDLQLNEALLEN